MKTSTKYRSLLGIALDEHRLIAAVLHRAGRGVEVRRSISKSMALDPLANDPELVGSEIRNLLNEAGIQEKRCVLCLSLKRALTMQTALPDLTEPDLTSYLQMQAEREFPLPIEHLSLSMLRSGGTNGTRHAIVAGVLSTHLDAHLKALRLAGLRPVGITFGVTSLGSEPGAPRDSKLMLLAWDGSIDLAVQKSGRPCLLRSIADIASYDQGRPEIHVDAIAKQLRITLGQIEPNLLDQIHSIQVFGPGRLAEPLRRDLEPYGKRMGLSIEAGGMPATVTASAEVLEQTSPAVLISAAQYLSGTAPELEFLPPRTNVLQRIVRRVSRRSALLPAGLVLIVVMILAGVFVQQHWRLSRLRSQWRSIQSEVSELESLQAQLRLYRPWFDNSNPSLLIASHLTNAFPEEGAVWVKTLEIRSIPDSYGLAVSCAGKARTDPEWQRMLKELRGREGVTKLQFQQVSGNNPLQFRLSFIWQEGAGDGE